MSLPGHPKTYEFRDLWSDFRARIPKKCEGRRIEGRMDFGFRLQGLAFRVQSSVQKAEKEHGFHEQFQFRVCV